MLPGGPDHTELQPRADGDMRRQKAIPRPTPGRDRQLETVPVPLLPSSYKTQDPAIVRVEGASSTVSTGTR